MGLDRLRESAQESGVKGLWERELSAEVQTMFEKIQEALGKSKETDALRSS